MIQESPAVVPGEQREATLLLNEYLSDRGSHLSADDHVRSTSASEVQFGDRVSTPVTPIRDRRAYEDDVAADHDQHPEGEDDVIGGPLLSDASNRSVSQAEAYRIEEEQACSIPGRANVGVEDSDIDGQ